MRKLGLFIIFLAFISIELVLASTSTEYTLLGCHPSKEYMVSLDKDYGDFQFQDYATSFRTIDTSNLSNDFDCTRLPLGYSCNDNDCKPFEGHKNFKGLWNRCSQELAQCYYLQKESATGLSLHLYCCNNTTIKDENGDFLEEPDIDPEDPRLKEFECTNLADESEVTYKEQEDIDSANCTPKNQSYSTCSKGHLDKINGVKVENQNRYFCDSVIDDDDIGYCCSFLSEPNISFSGCDPCFGKEGDEHQDCKDKLTEDELSEEASCKACMYDETGEPIGTIWTELGCIDPSPAGIITRIFQIGIGVMGGVAVLRFMQIAIAYQSKDPEKVKEAREMITSLLMGIVLLAGGIVLLQFLGINVLGLPAGFLGGT